MTGCHFDASFSSMPNNISPSPSNWLMNDSSAATSCSEGAPPRNAAIGLKMETMGLFRGVVFVTSPFCRSG